MAASRGFGVAGALDHSVVATLAKAVEELGYASFWANDTPGGEGLAALAAAARVTSRIDLGVGVIPVDRSTTDDIAQRIVELELPVNRLLAGIGAGGAQTGTIDLVHAAIEGLRSTGAKVYVGALGPRMCELAARAADGVLLNWLTPEAAAESANLIRRVAAEAGRPAPTVAAYVRTALASGTGQLDIEAGRYGSYPQYAAHFARMGVAAIETAVAGDPAEVAAGLARFDDVVDHVVVRAIVASESVEEYLELLSAARP